MASDDASAPNGSSTDNNSTNSSSSSSPPPPSTSPPSPDTSPPPQLSPPPPEQSPPPAVPSPPPPENTSTPPPTQSDSGTKSPFPPPRDSSSGSAPSPTQKSPPPAPNKTPDYSPPPSPSTSSGSHSPPAKALPKSQSPPKDSGGSKSSPSSSSSHSPNTIVVVGAAIGGFVILVVVVVCLACTRKKKRKEYYMGPPPPGRDEYYNGPPNWNTRPGEHVVKVPPPPGPWGGPSPLGPPSGEQSSVFSGSHPMTNASPGFRTNQSDFTYEELATATGGFSEANLLGQGGFGYVHKGVLPNGKEVAVKSLKIGSGQGEREFQAEVEIISRVHHRHLVSLVGYCIADGRKMLVYEFVPNKTLEFHLHGKGQPVMEWTTRLRIALGSAKGLAYLHEDCHPRIIHRDIKAANILLDYNNEAMVADFGLAKLSSDNYTHVSTRVMGTFGYLAPEYASSGKLTEKSDVFSFGVMLLELITGRQPVDLTNQYMEDSLVDWARPLLSKALEDGTYDELVDPRLENRYNPQEMARVISCAAASIRHSARRRPRMSQIVRALEGDSSLDDLNDTKPVRSSPYNTTPESSIYDTRAYNADMTKFRQMIMTDGDSSSEFGTTSEFGHNSSIRSNDSSEQKQKL